MRLPRDIAGEQLAKGLRVFGYQVTRQAGSPLRLTTTQSGEYHVTVPLHSPLKMGTLAGILGDVATRFNLGKDEVIARTFGR
jgi:predicted RNA binding protein YcfA (HicA-like mRNA interferase family)